MDTFWFAIGWLGGMVTLSVCFGIGLWFSRPKSGWKTYIDKSGGKVTTFHGTFGKSR